MGGGSVSHAKELTLRRPDECIRWEGGRKKISRVVAVTLLGLLAAAVASSASHKTTPDYTR